MTASTNNPPMYIGEVAKKTGLTIRAIRFYEAKQLIPPVKRSGRYRIYSQSDIEILLLIKEAKSLGIRLSELSKVIQYKEGQLNWQKVNLFLQDVKKQIKQDIQELEQRIIVIDQCMAQINQ